jgi:hypothetical protein
VPRWLNSLLVIAAVTIAAVGYRIYSERAGPRFDDSLRRAEAEMKSKLPMKVDEVTTLVRVKYEPTNTAYWLILDVRAEDKVDPGELEKHIRYSVCANGDTLRTIRDKHFTYEYHYVDRELQPLANFTIRQCP